MCSLQPLTYLQVQVLPRQGMVGPSSDSRLRLGETPAGASSVVNYSQRREGEANGPPGQRPAGVSRRGPRWTELVRPAHQAVVAFAGADMINRAEPRACGHSREPIHLNSEPDTERNAGFASNAAGDGCERARSDEAGFQPVQEIGPSSLEGGVRLIPHPYPYLWRCSVADPRGSFGNQLLLCRQCGRKERVFRRLHYLVVLFLATAAGGHRHSALRTPHSALRL